MTYSIHIPGARSLPLTIGHYLLSPEVIIASILFSWFPGYPSSRFMQAVYDAVNAVANPILMPIGAAYPCCGSGVSV